MLIIKKCLLWTAIQFAIAWHVGLHQCNLKTLEMTSGKLIIMLNISRHSPSILLRPFRNQEPSSLHTQKEKGVNNSSVCPSYPEQATDKFWYSYQVQSQFIYPIKNEKFCTRFCVFWLRTATPWRKYALFLQICARVLRNKSNSSDLWGWRN